MDMPVLAMSAFALTPATDYYNHFWRSFNKWTIYLHHLALWLQFNKIIWPLGSEYNAIKQGETSITDGISGIYMIHGYIGACRTLEVVP